MTSAPNLRAADGRIPGRRGQATRAKLLDATTTMLTETSYRDLTVVDIARRAGTSPATFYQYFADVEAAIVQLADAMADEGPALAEPARATWRGRAGYGSAVELVDGFLRFWEQHEGLLRVVDLAIVEGDQHLREIRTRLLNPVTLALRDAIAERGDGVDPAAHAAVLVSMLAHVAEHRHGLEEWGVRSADARESMARILYWSVTGRSAPAA